MEQGTCKLCGKYGDLKRSHIIPEPFYEPLYEEKLHQFLRYTTDGQRPKRGRKGFREPLLCPACEHITEVYDDYAIKVWNDHNDAKVQYHPSDKGLVVTGVDYVIMKLFFIITLWRMGVSRLPDFSSVSLGKKHENKLRQMILDKNPGRQYEYPVFLFGARKDARVREIMLRSMSILGSYRIDRHRAYDFLIGSLMWHFIVSSHLNDYQMKVSCSLRESGELVMYQNDELIEKVIRTSVPRFKK